MKKKGLAQRGLRVVTQFTALILCATFSFGCHSLQNAGAPAPSFDVDKDLAALAKQFGNATSIDQYYQNPTVTNRNKFIDDRLVLMNIRYIQFVRKSTVDKQVLDSASEILVLSLNLAGTAATGVAAKTILAAISAGVTGSKVAIDKNFYYEKTIPALITQMNAQRKVALLPILNGRKESLEDYPFEQAVTDLDTYYFAGTYLGAIQSIQTDAGVKDASAQAKLDQLTVLPAADIVTKTTLTKTIGQLTNADLDKVKAALATLDPSAPVPTDLASAKDQLQAAVRGARTSADIAKVAAAFTKAGITLATP